MFQRVLPFAKYGLVFCIVGSIVPRLTSAEEMTTVLKTDSGDWVMQFDTRTKEFIGYGPANDVRGTLQLTRINLKTAFRDVPTDRFQIEFNLFTNGLYFLNCDTGKLVGYRVWIRQSISFQPVFELQTSIGKNLQMDASPIDDEGKILGLFLFSAETGKLLLVAIKNGSAKKFEYNIQPEAQKISQDYEQANLGTIKLTDWKLHLSRANSSRRYGAHLSQVRINLVCSQGILRYRFWYGFKEGPNEFASMVWEPPAKEGFYATKGF